MTDDPQTQVSGAGFQTGGTPGGRWGCGLAAALVTCCLPMVLVLLTFGGDGRWWRQGLLPALAVALGLGLGARWLINRAWRAKGGEEAGRPPTWTLALSVAALIGAVWLLQIWWLRV